MADDESAKTAPSAPSAPTPTPEEQWLKSWAQEHGRYKVEREPLVKSELEAEKNFDSLIVTLASSALAGSVVLSKDFFADSSWTPLAITSWIFCSASLALALLDRYWTYKTHKKWRVLMDEALDQKNWHPGAFERLKDQYQNIKFIRVLPHLKIAALTTLAIGVFTLLVFISIARRGAPTPMPAVASPNGNVTVNVFSATTQPVAAKSP